MPWARSYKGKQFSNEEKARYHAEIRAKDPLKLCGACNRNAFYQVPEKKLAFCPKHLPPEYFHLRSKVPGSPNFQILENQLRKWVQFVAEVIPNNTIGRELAVETMQLMSSVCGPKKEDSNE